MSFDSSSLKSVHSANPYDAVHTILDSQTLMSVGTLIKDSEPSQTAKSSMEELNSKIEALTQKVFQQEGQLKDVIQENERLREKLSEIENKKKEKIKALKGRVKEVEKENTEYVQLFKEISQKLVSAGCLTPKDEPFTRAEIQHAFDGLMKDEPRILHSYNKICQEYGLEEGSPVEKLLEKLNDIHRKDAEEIKTFVKKAAVLTEEKKMHRQRELSELAMKASLLSYNNCWNVITNPFKRTSVAS